MHEGSEYVTLKSQMAFYRIQKSTSAPISFSFRKKKKKKKTDSKKFAGWELCLHSFQPNKIQKKNAAIKLDIFLSVWQLDSHIFPHLQKCQLIVWKEYPYACSRFVSRSMLFHLSPPHVVKPRTFIYHYYIYTGSFN